MSYYHDLTAMKAERDRLARLTWDNILKASELGINCARQIREREKLLADLDQAFGTRWNKGWLEVSYAEDQIMECKTASLDLIAEDLDYVVLRYHQYERQSNAFTEEKGALRQLPRQLRTADGVNENALLKRTIKLAAEMESALACWRSRLDEVRDALLKGDACRADWRMKEVRAFHLMMRALSRQVAEGKLVPATNGC